jgi:hypothetical protein
VTQAEHHQWELEQQERAEVESDEAYADWCEKVNRELREVENDGQE